MSRPQIPSTNPAIPAEWEAFFGWHLEAAKKKPGKLHRLWSGFYFAFVNGKMKQIDFYEANGEWYVSDYNESPHDSYQTLREAKINCEIEKTNTS